MRVRSSIAHACKGVPRYGYPVKAAGWGWIWGILTALGVVFAIIFFIATQTITGRDFITLAIGAAVGGGAAGIVAVFIFYRHDREAERQERKDTLKADQDNARRESDARIAREDREAEARISREQQLLDKQLESVEALPTRSERIQELRQKEAVGLMDIQTARGEVEAEEYSARRAQDRHYRDEAARHLASSVTWSLKAQYEEEQLQRTRDEIARVQALTDEEFLMEQKHLRGLD